MAQETEAHPLLTDMYGLLMNAVHELAPTADDMVGFAIVVWDVNGNVAALHRRNSDYPYDGGAILPMVKGALTNQRTFEALN